MWGLNLFDQLTNVGHDGAEYATILKGIHLIRIK